MKIISKFKDYYDYVGYAYGGGDPLVTYNRGIVRDPSPKSAPKQSIYYTQNSQVEKPLPFYVDMWPNLPLMPQTVNDYLPRGGIRVDFPWDFRWCFVAGKYYLLAGTPNFAPSFAPSGYWDWKILRDSHPCFEYLVMPKDYLKKQKVYAEKFHGIETKKGCELAKILQAPVFVIPGGINRYAYSSSGDRVSVDPWVPNLGKMGFASIIPAEQMYQEIAMFCTNVLRDNPDTLPPANVCDKDRLVQKGFDPVVSFRGSPRKAR